MSRKKYNNCINELYIFIISKNIKSHRKIRTNLRTALFRSNLGVLKFNPVSSLQSDHFEFTREHERARPPRSFASINRDTHFGIALLTSIYYIIIMQN